MAGRVSGETEWSNGVMQRQDSRTWIKTMIISELSSVYTGDSDPNPPILHSSIAPLLQRSCLEDCLRIWKIALFAKMPGHVDWSHGDK
jgi:hypothetical protein